MNTIPGRSGPAGARVISDRHSELEYLFPQLEMIHPDNEIQIMTISGVCVLGIHGALQLE